MLQRIKILLSLLMIFIVMMQSVGVLLILNVQQQGIKHQMQELLLSDTTLFEDMTMTKEAYLQSRVDKKEIRLNGQMYDVKSVVFKGDIVALKVINDKDEERVIQKIDKHVNHNQRDKKTSNRFLQLLTANYLLSEFMGRIIIYCSDNIIFKPIDEIYFSLKLEIPSPPPKLS